MVQMEMVIMVVREGKAVRLGGRQVMVAMVAMVAMAVTAVIAVY
ncbi:hypothetical protein SEEGA711_00010 [Salmonella enterica subsp. enterica serovar Gaminara str. ATCC BAA-711]|uniref:Uncharacterized protein n=1 Tax=Salmonella enterica subsp. enterica serovar Rubislaw str. A4-653 TaxID=913081 RepID=G5QJT7_SALRU|nr:hypothetical protein LTSERUB_2896 [Salmonella enterica subsp. enterica serovar Rubislaw str. A4-653]ESH24039.1 hypothetical protein SEEGA711_00010 [Salmonella enterica subsp. enterica serovar Gaminara str. ATCC BAA-711]